MFDLALILQPPGADLAGGAGEGRSHAVNDNLRELSDLLREGQKRSQQGAYQRRAPAAPAVPYLQQARQGLRLIVETEPGNVDAWRLLSQTEEALLDYRLARIALDKVLASQARPDRRDLKRLALLRECEVWWAGLGLTPTQLAELGDYLASMLPTPSTCDHTLHHTRRWLERSGLSNLDRIVAALQQRGGHCDCEVSRNVT